MLNVVFVGHPRCSEKRHASAERLSGPCAAWTALCRSSRRQTIPTAYAGFALRERDEGMATTFRVCLCDDVWYVVLV
eukprot:scaffold181953_cov35-Tisochrysis_lutea.AAC.2